MALPDGGEGFFAIRGDGFLERAEIERLLNAYKDGGISIDEAAAELSRLPYEDIGFANVDHHREMRQGFPEVIFAEGKTAAQVTDIMRALLRRSGKSVMASRVSSDKAKRVMAEIGDAVYDEEARILYVRRGEKPVDESRKILVLTAGTSDIPVAAEAALTAEMMGNCVTRLYDVGVAGIHRLFAHEKEITEANVIIVVAGMEGALASVVGGLTARPVIAVPTSVGYGASFHGVSALLAMLNSCSAGVAVMNIDNGFGAGVLAGKINRIK